MSDQDDGRPPIAERAEKARQGLRWCIPCRRYTDGTYAENGNLCGPGCFNNCEPELGRFNHMTGVIDVDVRRLHRRR